jgi:hypothetical protein
MCYYNVNINGSREKLYVHKHEICHKIITYFILQISLAFVPNKMSAPYARTVPCKHIYVNCLFS